MTKTKKVDKAIKAQISAFHRSGAKKNEGVKNFPTVRKVCSLSIFLVIRKGKL